MSSSRGSSAKRQQAPQQPSATVAKKGGSGGGGGGGGSSRDAASASSNRSGSSCGRRNRSPSASANGGSDCRQQLQKSEMSNGDNYFSAHQMKALKEAFNFFDIDHDGRITAGELHKVLKFLGTKVTEHEVKMMIADVDSDGNGTVEFNEFLKMMKKYYRKNAHCHSEESEMWEAFKAFDHNGDNFIDFAEIKKTMHFLGEEVSDEDVQSMINEADADNDGRINFEEFKKMMQVMQQRSENHC